MLPQGQAPTTSSNGSVAVPRPGAEAGLLQDDGHHGQAQHDGVAADPDNDGNHAARDDGGRLPEHLIAEMLQQEPAVAGQQGAASGAITGIIAAADQLARQPIPVPAAADEPASPASLAARLRRLEQNRRVLRELVGQVRAILVAVDASREQLLEDSVGNSNSQASYVASCYQSLGRDAA